MRYDKGYPYIWSTEKKNYCLGLISALMVSLEVGITEWPASCTGMTDGDIRSPNQAMIIQSHLMGVAK